LNIFYLLYFAYVLFILSVDRHGLEARVVEGLAMERGLAMGQRLLLFPDRVPWVRLSRGFSLRWPLTLANKNTYWQLASVRFPIPFPFPWLQLFVGQVSIQHGNLCKCSYLAY